MQNEQPDYPQTPRETRALAWLNRADLRPTRQRLALADLLVGDGKDRHVCAESLFESARAQMSISLATVYNTLRLFCDAGLLQEITVDGQKSYFDTRLDPHLHYFWEEEARLSDAPNGAVRFHTQASAPKGMEIARLDVIIRLRKKRGA